MKKGILFVWLLLALFLAVSANAETDCRILWIEEQYPGAWIVGLSTEGLPPAEVINLEAYDSVAGFRESGSCPIVNKIAVCEMWTGPVEFRYGVRVDGIDYWSDPSCSRYVYEGRLRWEIWNVAGELKLKPVVEPTPVPPPSVSSPPVPIMPGVMYLMWRMGRK